MAAIGPDDEIESRMDGCSFDLYIDAAVIPDL